MNEVTIGVLCTVIGTCLGIYTAVSYAKKETKQENIRREQEVIKNEKESKEEAKEEASCNTRIETKIDYIGKDINDIKMDFRAQATKISIIEERVTRVEESAKSAHKRLDGIGEDYKETL